MNTRIISLSNLFWLGLQILVLVVFSAFLVAPLFAGDAFLGSSHGYQPEGSLSIQQFLSEEQNQLQRAAPMGSSLIAGDGGCTTQHEWDLKDGTYSEGSRKVTLETRPDGTRVKTAREYDDNGVLRSVEVRERHPDWTQTVTTTFYDEKGVITSEGGTYEFNLQKKMEPDGSKPVQESPSTFPAAGSTPTDGGPLIWDIGPLADCYRNGPCDAQPPDDLWLAIQDYWNKTDPPLIVKPEAIAKPVVSGIVAGDSVSIPQPERLDIPGPNGQIVTVNYASVMDAYTQIWNRNANENLHAAHPISGDELREKSEAEFDAYLQETYGISADGFLAAYGVWASANPIVLGDDPPQAPVVETKPEPAGGETVNCVMAPCGPFTVPRTGSETTGSSPTGPGSSIEDTAIAGLTPTGDIEDGEFVYRPGTPIIHVELLDDGGFIPLLGHGVWTDIPVQEDAGALAVVNAFLEEVLP